MKTHQSSHNTFIVTSHRSLLKRVLETLFTVSFWCYGLSVGLFFAANLFNINFLNVRLLNGAFKLTVEEINAFFYLSLFLFALILMSLFAWKFYNSRRFGRLRRRTYPKDTTYDDLLALNLVDNDTLMLLQTSNLVSFETNPIQQVKAPITLDIPTPLEEASA